MSRANADRRRRQVENLLEQLVDVVAFLPRHLLSHLKVVLGSEHSLTPVASWSELQTTVQHQATDIIVADPSATGSVRTSNSGPIRSAA